jgi:hypothetical protein
MSTFYPSTGVGDTFEQQTVEETTEGGQITYIIRGWIKTAKTSSLADEDSDYGEDTDYHLKRKSVIAQSETPDISDVTYTYRKSSSTSSAIWDTASTEKSSSTIPIAVSVDSTVIPSALKTQQTCAVQSGLSTFEVGGVSYQYTIYKYSFVWTAAALMTASTGEIVGDLGTPTGLTGCTAGCWKFRGNSISEQNGTTRVVENWEGCSVPYVSSVPDVS